LPEITFKITDFEKIMGMTFDDEKVSRILSSLGFRVVEVEPGSYSVIPTSARHDIKIKEDLLEEIARLMNYDTLKSEEFLSRPVYSKDGDAEHKFHFLNSVKKFIASTGYDEVVNYSFISDELKTLFFHADDAIEVSNPISAEFAYMRPSLIPNLLSIVQKLLNYGEREVNIFEAGQVYVGDKELTHIAALSAFPDQKHNIWNDKTEKGVFDVKRDLFSLLRVFDIDMDAVSVTTEAVPHYMHIARTGEVLVEGIKLGFFGELSPKILSKMGIKLPVYVYYLDFEKFFENRDVLLKKTKKFFDNKLQKVYRDFAFVFDKGVEVQKIKNSIKIDRRITDIMTFDVYNDDLLGEDNVSIAFNVELEQIDGKILTDEEIQDLSSKIIKSVGKIGGVLRN